MSVMCLVCVLFHGSLYPLFLKCFSLLLQHLIRRHSGAIEGKRVFEYCVLEYAE